MARDIVTPYFTVLDSSGDPVSGAKLQFYQTGTTTPLDTYSDNALTTANANPVVADSAGRVGPIFLKAEDYKLVVSDSADAEIRTIDPVHGGSSADLVTATGASSSRSLADWLDTRTRSVTSTDTLVATDQGKTILVDASSGAVTINLLAAATAGNGYAVTIKKTDSSTNAVTLDPNSTETIDGAATVDLATQYQAVILRCDGSNWHIAAKHSAASFVDLAVTNDLSVASQKLQAFSVQIRNNSGTLEHRIGAVGSPGTASNYAGQVTGASATYATTPTGTDASTDFTNGGKVSSASDNAFILDTAAQTIADHLSQVSLAQNTSGTDMFVRIVLVSRDVNGTTRIRPEIRLQDASDGSDLTINTTNIPNTKVVEVQIQGYLA